MGGVKDPIVYPSSLSGHHRGRREGQGGKEREEGRREEG
jgi:hypothetical protein